MRAVLPTLLVMMLLVGPLARAATFHVAPDGTPGGDGSAGRAWDLATALGQPPAVRAADELVLAPGTYAGTFTSKLTGEPGKPVTVRAAPGGRVTIDCQPPAGKPDQASHFTVQGAHAVYQGFEVTCSSPGRRTEITGSHPKDVNRGGINAFGSHLKFVNLVVHDTGQGFGFWSNGEGGEIYGCLIYHNGWDAPDRGHGHAIYTQNKAGTKVLADNILWGQFSYGIHAYGSSRASLVGFHIEGNVAFLNGAPASKPGKPGRTPGILVGGGSPCADVVVVNNFTWADRPHTTIQLGYDNANKNLVCRDNFVVGGLSTGKWETATIENNTLIRPGGDDRPKEARVFLRPNKYEPGRAHLVVYNFPRAEAVEVDLGAVLKPGAAYRIVSARAPFGPPVLAGTCEGRPVSLPMKPVPAARVVGFPDEVPPVTEPEFGVYVVSSQ